MDRFGVTPGHRRETPRGAAGRRTQSSIDIALGQNMQEASHQGGLADTWAAGHDQHLGSARSFESLALACRKRDAERFLRLGYRIRRSIFAPRQGAAGKFAQSRRHIELRAVEPTREETVPALDFVHYEFARRALGVDDGREIRDGHAEQMARPFESLVGRQPAMAVLDGFCDDTRDSGAQADGCSALHADARMRCGPPPRIRNRSSRAQAGRDCDEIVSMAARP